MKATLVVSEVMAVNIWIEIAIANFMLIMIGWLVDWTEKRTIARDYLLENWCK